MPITTAFTINSTLRMFCLTEIRTVHGSLLRGVGFLMSVVGGLVLLAGCASTSSGSQDWSGELARTYEASTSDVVNATSKAIENIGMSRSTRQVSESTYVVEATKEVSGNRGQRMQITGMSIYVRNLGEAVTNLEVRIPERNVGYASQRDDAYAQQQADRVLDLLDRQFSASQVVEQQ